MALTTTPALKKTNSRAFAPATAANLACGFDVLGLALSNPGDEVVVQVLNETFGKSGQTLILDITGDGGVLPRDPATNTATVAINAWRQATGFNLPLGVSIHKKMPLGSGLGSSAASAVAAVVAANDLLAQPLPKRALLPFVLEAERIACGSAHADNVAPALLGGIVLIRSYQPLEVISLPVPTELYMTVVHPELEVRTELSRAIMRRQVPLSIAVEQSGNLAGFVTACFTGDYELLSRCLHDAIAEPVRSPLIPNFLNVKQAALLSGALGCSISGSGPSVFAMCKGESVATKAGIAMAEAFATVGIQTTIHTGQVNTTGAYILE